MVFALVPALAACQTLLPDAETRIVSGWASYNEAVESLEKIVPFVTERKEVRASGLDPVTNPALTILNYADLMQRFAASAALPPDELDRGVRDCVKAGKRCTAYAINVRNVDRKRVGSFWLDTFNFKRHTVTTGWSFNALIIFVDDLVVYVLVGGQPNIQETDVVRNPLGPLQGFGDAIRPTLF